MIRSVLVILAIVLVARAQNVTTSSSPSPSVAPVSSKAAALEATFSNSSFSELITTATNVTTLLQYAPRVDSDNVFALAQLLQSYSEALLSLLVPQYPPASLLQMLAVLEPQLAYAASVQPGAQLMLPDTIDTVEDVMEVLLAQLSLGDVLLPSDYNVGMAMSILASVVACDIDKQFGQRTLNLLSATAAVLSGSAGTSVTKQVTPAFTIYACTGPIGTALVTLDTSVGDSAPVPSADALGLDPSLFLSAQAIWWQAGFSALPLTFSTTPTSSGQLVSTYVCNLNGVRQLLNNSVATEFTFPRPAPFEELPTKDLVAALEAFPFLVCSARDNTTFESSAEYDSCSLNIDDTTDDGVVCECARWDGDHIVSIYPSSLKGGSNSNKNQVILTAVTISIGLAICAVALIGCVVAAIVATVRHLRRKHANAGKPPQEV